MCNVNVGPFNKVAFSVHFPQVVTIYEGRHRSTRSDSLRRHSAQLQLFAASKIGKPGCSAPRNSVAATLAAHQELILDCMEYLSMHDTPGTLMKVRCEIESKLVFQAIGVDNAWEKQFLSDL